MYLTTIKLEESETINYMVPRTYQYITTIVAISTKGMIYINLFCITKKCIGCRKSFLLQRSIFPKIKNVFINKGIYENKWTEQLFQIFWKSTKFAKKSDERLLYLWMYTHIWSSTREISFAVVNLGTLFV